jgi:hypothetical protein
MRKKLQKIMEILDGTPAVYENQKRWRGQSVVELSLVTPILIVLLMGLAEIGWFANNYLILLEVTRVGARLGTTLTAETSPLSWNNLASRSPYTGFGDFPTLINGTNRNRYYTCSEVRNPNNTELRGFYNYIGCVMTQQMDPLIFDGENDVDDIVISAFSLQAIDPAALPNTPMYYTSSSSPRTLITPSLDAALNNTKQIVVVGRYPSNANECTVDRTGAGREWERDPFDFFKNNTRDFIREDVSRPPEDEDNRFYVELAGYDALTYEPYTGAGSNMPERQRGWVFFAQHGMSDAFNPTTGIKHCYGSEWTIDEVETLMNLPGFGLLNPQRQRVPSQGIVLVEMFWKHELLLKNPVFNPVWTILGDSTMISVWAAFPLPTTEPRLKFD